MAKKKPRIYPGLKWLILSASNPKTSQVSRPITTSTPSGMKKEKEARTALERINGVLKFAQGSPIYEPYSNKNI